MLEARALRVIIGKTALLEDVSASMAQGRVTAIVGPNGAGKSTLLSCLAGLRLPDGGGALLDEQAVPGMRAADRARRIGYLPQEGAVHWNIGVRALVALGRFPHRRGLAGDSEADRDAVTRALEEVGLCQLADRAVGTLSGGERARALLARVLAGEPDWILADEPLAALDLAHRYALMRHFRAVAARGVGVLIVLHDLALAARMADDAILLDRGRLVAAGTAQEVLSPARLGPVFGVDFSYGTAADGGAVLVSAPRMG
jgi:iron complex transport system ATP-binding protein